MFTWGFVAGQATGFFCLLSSLGGTCIQNIFRICSEGKKKRTKKSLKHHRFIANSSIGKVR